MAKKPMFRRGFGRVAVCVLLLGGLGAGAAYWWLAMSDAPNAPPIPLQPDAPPASTKPLTSTDDALLKKETPSIERLSPAELAAKIDAYFLDSWKKNGVEPAAVAADDEFLRRIYLDVAGKIPSAGEARDFLDDRNPNKRADLVVRLLNHARFSNHLAVTLRETLLPGADNDPQKRAFVPGFEGWLRLRLSDGVPYDELVREMLTAQPPRNDNSAPAARRTSFGPEAFVLVHESKPELLAGSAARALLGIQVQCAECHDHPTDEWKQEQFWSFAAFFVAPTAGVSTQPALELEIPTKKTKVRPKFLDGESASFSSGAPSERRQAVAEWIVKNPNFSRAIANRVWLHFTGRGLCHPVDDVGTNNPPSHPVVLDWLAEQFKASGCSLRYLSEVVARTTVYARSSNPPARPTEPSAFAAMPVRTMSPEQLYDSLMRAAFGRSTADEPAPNEAAALMGDTRRTQFLRKFWEPVERTGARGSILHALALMNGPVLALAANPDKGTVLHAVLTSPFLSDAERIETLFLAAITRRPTPAESAKFSAYVKSKGNDDAGKRQAFADVLWALLNSSEFAMTR